MKRKISSTKRSRESMGMLTRLGSDSVPVCGVSGSRPQIKVKFQERTVPRKRLAHHLCPTQNQLHYVVKYQAHNNLSDYRRIRARAATTAEEVSQIEFYRQQWYPLAPLDLLDKSKPHPMTIIGEDVVLWHDNEAWNCFKNACPHRCAPLSEGKVIEVGGKKTLMCSYHGWKFQGDGNCVSIPQASSREKEQALCSNSNSCAASYPCQEAQGLLWVFMGEKEDSKNVSIPICSYIENTKDKNDLTYIMRPFFRDLPYDFTTLVENVADPSHVPFSHHSVQGNRDSVKYGMSDMELADDVDPESDDEIIVHTKNHGMFVNNVSFLPPYKVRYFGKISDEEFTSFNVYCVPTKPGWSRLISYIATTRKLPFLIRMFLKLPSFLDHALVRNKVLDGDSVFLHYQEHYLRDKETRDGKSWSDLFYTPNSSDTLLLRARNWFDKQGSPYLKSRKSPELITDHRVLLNRYEQHTKNCTKCLRALRVIEALKWLTAVGTCASFGAILSLWVVMTANGMGSMTLKSVALPGLLGSVFALLYKMLSDLRTQFFYVPYVHNDK